MKENFLNNMGWECPKCGNVYAPFVSTCFNCMRTVSVVTNTQNTTLVPEQETPKPDGMVENPTAYPSNTSLSEIFPTRLSHALHNKLIFREKWVCVETIGDLTNIINKYGFNFIEDCRNVGSKSVELIANLYGITIYELRNKNPEIGYWKKEFK